MKNIKDFFGLTILLTTIFLMNSCDDDLPFLQTHTNCNNKPILTFNTIADLQSEYNGLKADYDATTDNQVLIDYENNNNFYSLRKKDSEMDDGIIPDDPLFDIFNYCDDFVFGTFLNEDGMIIINNELYIWSSSCVGYKAPFSCSNYTVLNDLIADFHSGAMTDALYQNYVNTSNISLVDLCADEFEFESNYDGYTFEGGSNRGSGCALQTGISVKILSNNNITKVAEIELEAYNINPGIPVLNTWYINNITGPEVTITGGSNPALVNQLWNQMGNGFFVGKTLRIRVDYTSLIYLDLEMYSVNTDLSCFGMAIETVDLICPILLNAEPLNVSSGQWQFSIEGLQPGQVGLWQWDFGDGTPPVFSSSTSMVHNYNIPCCGAENYTVVVQDAEQIMPCNFPLTKQVIIGNPCRLSKFRDRSPNFFLDPAHREQGRRVAFMHKIKRNGKVKSWLRHRISGEKKIEVLSGGEVWFSTGTGCNSIELSELVKNGPDSNPATLNKKRRVKQRYRDGTRYCIDLNNPYTIRFTTANGYTKDYTKNMACMSVQ